MSSAHHGGGHGGRSPEQEELMRRFLDQTERRARRQYPNGRLGADDSGALAIAVAADPANGIVRIDFGKPVEWLGLPPAEVMGLVKLLVAKAREVATEPLTVDLG